ncbi:MAG: hypothetical protein RJA25_1427 [Bacteroidota bacterium]|jgi:hypothetical protein
MTQTHKGNDFILHKFYLKIKFILKDYLFIEAKLLLFKFSLVASLLKIT